MPPSDSPLADAQAEGDKLKLAIDEFVLTCRSSDDSGVVDRQTEIKQLLDRCKELISSVTKLEKKVSKLKKSQEPSTTSRFEVKKKDEANRLAAFKSQLEHLKSTMEADEVEEDYLRNFEENNNLASPDDDYDEEGPASQKSEEGQHGVQQSTSPTKSRFSRLGLFRRSKSPAKGAGLKVEGGVGVAEENNGTGMAEKKKKMDIREDKNRGKKKEQVLVKEKQGRERESRTQGVMGRLKRGERNARKQGTSPRVDREAGITRKAGTEKASSGEESEMDPSEEEPKRLLGKNRGKKQEQVLEKEKQGRERESRIQGIMGRLKRGEKNAQEVGISPRNGRKAGIPGRAGTAKASSGVEYEEGKSEEESDEESEMDPSEDEAERLLGKNRGKKQEQVLEKQKKGGERESRIQGIMGRLKRGEKNARETGTSPRNDRKAGITRRQEAEEASSGVEYEEKESGEESDEESDMDSSEEEPEGWPGEVSEGKDASGHGRTGAGCHRGLLPARTRTDRKQKVGVDEEPVNSRNVQSTKGKKVEEPHVEDEDHDSSYIDSEEGESEYEEEEESDDDVVVGGQPGSSKGQQGSSRGHPTSGSAGQHPKPTDMVQQDAAAAAQEEDDDEEDESLEDEEEEYETGEEEEGEDELEDEEESSSEEEGGDLPPGGENLFVVLCDFEAEEPTDLQVKQGDVVTILSTREDGWWRAEDEEGNTGLVPSTYLKLNRDSVDSQAAETPDPNDEEVPSPSSGKELWKSVRKATHETTTSDVLSAMGAIPAGFRQSLTAKLLNNEQNKMSHSLKPALSESGLSFKDLLWDPQTRQLRAVPCRIQKMLSLVLVRNMPAMGTGLETKCRYARIAIFDGKEVLSNIHTVQATWNEGDPKTWRFSPRVSGILPSILDGDCFIRTDRSEKNIGLLLELCVFYVRTKTGEQGELSCGWVHLPLYSEETGGPIINKLYDLPVQGGTPFEQGVEVDPTISRKASTSKFRSMLTTNKQPRIHIKLVAPTKEQKAQLEMLPFTIVSVASYLPLMSIYRKILADAVLRDRIDVQSTELIHSPLLANFPKAANLPDVMDGLRSMWNEKKRSTKKSEKRDGEQMKALFNAAFMDSAYPVLYSATLPPYKWPEMEMEQVRWESISNFTAASHQKGILTALLTPGKMHTPFHTSEVSFDILGAYTHR